MGLAARGENFQRGSRQEVGVSNSVGSLRKEKNHTDEAAYGAPLSAIKSTKRAFHINIESGIVRPKHTSKAKIGRDDPKFKSVVSPNLDIMNELDTVIRKNGGIVVK